MRVAFNAVLLQAPSLRGWNRYTRELILALREFDLDILLLTRGPLDQKHHDLLENPRVRLLMQQSRTRYFLFEQAWIPKVLLREQVDVLHSPFNYGVPVWSPCPRVLTLHDAIMQVYYGARQSLIESLQPKALAPRFYHWQARRSAERIITVSQHARSDLVLHLGVDPKKIDVIPEAAAEAFRRQVTKTELQEIQSRLNLPRRYFFYVGGLEARKNLPFLIEAMRLAAAQGLEGDVGLVIGGGSAREQAQLAQLAANNGLGSRTKFLGEVDDADLPALYHGALAFVYPSAYEGFGLQLCEAMAAGCPVFASQAASLPEVLQSGGISFPLSDAGVLAGLLLRVSADGAFRSEMVERARLRSKVYSWSKTAAATYTIYLQLLRLRGR